MLTKPRMPLDSCCVPPLNSVNRSLTGKGRYAEALDFTLGDVSSGEGLLPRWIICGF